MAQYRLRELVVTVRSEVIVPVVDLGVQKSQLAVGALSFVAKRTVSSLMVPSTFSAGIAFAARCGVVIGTLTISRKARLPAADRGCGARRQRSKGSSVAGRHTPSYCCFTIRITVGR